MELMAKIIACIRTLNEQDNIEKCCQSYAPFCDKILIADGGSVDNTVDIAQEMPKTLVRNYDVRVNCKKHIWRNPDYLHLQFLWDWAQEEGADWIISQDCDQRPNKDLKNDARFFMEHSEKDFILATQIYLWGEDQYFRQLSNQGGWMQGLWAWRANINLKVIDNMPHFLFSFDGVASINLDQLPHRCERILPPHCYMHYGWPTEEKTLAHMKYYHDSGLIKGMRHPKDFGGDPEPILPWMVE